MDQSIAAGFLRSAMDDQHVTDATMRAAIAAIAMGESALNPRSETGYGHTANARIRAIFGSRVRYISDAEMDALKANDAAFFERVYGGAWGRANLGNTEAGDGFRYRGRGFFQLTGRGNYITFGRAIGRPDLVEQPALANDPAISAAIAVAYMKGRYKGGGWEGMKRAVGNSVAGVGETKDRLFKQYLASGEFATGAAPVEARPYTMPTPTAPHPTAADPDHSAGDLNRQEFERRRDGA